jgi:hypothetical protein
MEEIYKREGSVQNLKEQKSIINARRERKAGRLKNGRKDNSRHQDSNLGSPVCEAEPMVEGAEPSFLLRPRVSSKDSICFCCLDHSLLQSNSIFNSPL